MRFASCTTLCLLVSLAGCGGTHRLDERQYVRLVARAGVQAVQGRRDAWQPLARAKPPKRWERLNGELVTALKEHRVRRFFLLVGPLVGTRYRLDDPWGSFARQVRHPGARTFAASGCTTCHTYGGFGARNLGAPDLTHEGRRGRGLAWQLRHLRCPQCVVPGSPMPRFGALGPARLRRVAMFLEASR